MGLQIKGSHRVIGYQVVLPDHHHTFLACHIERSDQHVTTNHNGLRNGSIKRYRRMRETPFLILHVRSQPLLEISHADSEQCLALAALLGNKTSFPSSTQYVSSLDSYFTLQETEVHPLCIVSPQTAEDVSVAVSTLTSISSDPSLSIDARRACRFATRSGGHTAFAGAANIQGGVTIDLRGLNTIDVSPDRSTASIGVGNTWDTVYESLDALNLSVTGGRTAGVGVGGLTVGGGISYFGTRYGWTADTISNFQVVLADGSLVNANATHNPELLWALRGGGNNFGVVTRVDLQAFEQVPFWGGAAYHAASVWPEEVREFVKINSADDYDEYAALTLTWAYTASVGVVVTNQLVYTKNTSVETPPIFEGIASLPSLYSSLGTTTMAELSIELAAEQVDGER